MHRRLTLLLPAARTPFAAPPSFARRTYALSRYRGNNGRSPSSTVTPADNCSVSRIGSRRHAVEPARSAARQPTSPPSDVNAPIPARSQPDKPSFWQSFDTYTPSEAVQATASNPPPVNPGDLLRLDHGAAAILSEPSLVVCRQIEMMNVFLGFEQANRYRLCNAKGETVGFLAEQEGGFGSSIRRQMMRNHRRESDSLAKILADHISSLFMCGYGSRRQRRSAG